ncbi:MAG TPA: ABC transporter ATP-binding protein [Bacillota bacterium]|nr:ABC transporter ATP-binding protein [Bacillota bacterium]
MPKPFNAGPREKFNIKKHGKTLKRLLGYIFRDYKWRFIFVLVCILFSAIAGAAGSIFIRILIDDYITPMIGVSDPVFSGLLTAIGILALIYVVWIASSYLYNRTMVVMAQGIMKNIRDEMFSNMQDLPISYYDGHTHGDLMSRYTNDADTLRQMLAQSVPQFISSMATVIVIFFAMLFSNAVLTLIVIVCVVLMMMITKKIASVSGKYFVAQQKSLGETNGFIEEMVEGEKVIKVFCHEEKTKEQFDVLNDKLRVNATMANKFATLMMPVMNNLGNLQYVIIAVIGSALCILGFPGITLGVVASFMQLSKNFTMPINQIANQFNSIIVALAGADRIFQLMDAKKEEDEGYVTLVNVERQPDGTLKETKEKTNLWAWKHLHKDGKLEYVLVQGKVTFNDVDFAYEPGKTVLHNITLQADKAEKIAFVGHTGAGKTTITNLLNRFYDIADGKIRIDGININKIRKPDLRHSLGMVLQDTNLFTGTIKDNIRFGKLDASDEEIIDAAKRSNADGFIRMLPDGYDTMLTPGGNNLSQGQRQLLSIARAAVANPPILVLDEATSSIDTRTEAIVQKGMDRLMEGRTVFVIAHRLSTIHNSDVIVVLDQGRIIEIGNHEKLINKKGMYYQLYTGAFELE